MFISHCLHGFKLRNLLKSSNITMRQNTSTEEVKGTWFSDR